MFLAIFLLALAAGPMHDRLSEELPPETLYAASEGPEAYIGDTPRGTADGFEAEGEDPSPLNPDFDVLSIRSGAAILAVPDTGSALLKKNADTRVYPASLTKIMTVLIAIERLDELPETVVLDPASFIPLREAESTMAGFKPGEKVRTVDLIYGALLLSGGECCTALARAVAGSDEAFAAVMNARARDFGMFDTHFTNPTGLHDPEHYSTAGDVAKLLIHALRNEDFEKAFTTEEYETAPSDMRGKGMTFTGNMFSRIRTVEFEGGRILGGKTGWTEEAGRCLASLAEKDGNRYVFVSMGGGVSSDGTSYNFEDALNAYGNAILTR
jgi:D-alanyl-D-alanine carboxypeptidase (penicillin-binding protein 5/6)